MGTSHRQIPGFPSSARSDVRERRREVMEAWGAFLRTNLSRDTATGSSAAVSPASEPSRRDQLCRERPRPNV